MEFLKRSFRYYRAAHRSGFAMRIDENIQTTRTLRTKEEPAEAARRLSPAIQEAEDEHAPLKSAKNESDAPPEYIKRAIGEEDRLRRVSQRQRAEEAGLGRKFAVCHVRQLFKDRQNQRCRDKPSKLTIVSSRLRKVFEVTEWKFQPLQEQKGLLSTDEKEAEAQQHSTPSTI